MSGYYVEKRLENLIEEIEDIVKWEFRNNEEILKDISLLRISLGLGVRL